MAKRRFLGHKHHWTASADVAAVEMKLAAKPMPHHVGCEVSQTAAVVVVDMCACGAIRSSLDKINPGVAEVLARGMFERASHRVYAASIGDVWKIDVRPVCTRPQHRRPAPEHVEPDPPAPPVPEHQEKQPPNEIMYPLSVLEVDHEAERLISLLRRSLGFALTELSAPVASKDRAEVIVEAAQVLAISDPKIRAAIRRSDDAKDKQGEAYCRVPA